MGMTNEHRAPTTPPARRRTAAGFMRVATKGPVLAFACVVAVGAVACGDDDPSDSAGREEPTATTGSTSDGTETEGGSEGGCSLIETGVVEGLFAVELESVEETLPGQCYFSIDTDKGTNVFVSRIDGNGQTLYDGAVDEAMSFGGTGFVPVDVGDEAMGEGSENSGTLHARAGDVYVSVNSHLDLGGDAQANLAAAAELAELVL